jgi:hypothetical protein
MFYPPTKLDQFLHRIPGGDAIAHQLGKMTLDFKEAAQPDKIKALKAKIAEDIKPITDRLESIPEDANKRRWHTFIRTDQDILDESQSEIRVTFGHFNEAERRAFLYFQRNGGMPVYPATGQSWGSVSARSYELTVPADRGGGKPIYQGYLPVAADKDYPQKRGTSHKIALFADYFLNRALPHITEQKSSPKPETPPAAPIPPAA